MMVVGRIVGRGGVTGITMLALVASFASTGCGSSAEATGATPGTPAIAESGLAGTVDGRAFFIRDAIAAVTLHWKSGLSPGSSTVVLLSDTTGFCDQIKTNLTKPDTQLLILDLGEVTSGTAAPITGPGTFPWSTDLISPRTSSIYYSFVDSACGFHKDFATAGEVSITAFAAGAASMGGSLDVTLGGGSLRGAFAAHDGCPTDAVDTYLNLTPKCP